MNPENNPNVKRAITVIIPVFNEENAIIETINDIDETLQSSEREYEIIAVDDCSTDDTERILAEIDLPRLRVIRHKLNRGYGAALKTGVRAATTPLVVITDADGTYPNARIPELANCLGNNDMVVGSRNGKNVKIPWIRKPAKWFIGKLANYLSRYKIPDINSGLRVFKRETLLQYLSILPDGFSFTTTITLAMLTCGNDVIYIPIDYAPRIGKSKIKPIRDTLNFVQLIIRTILLFEPLRVFLPVSFCLLMAAIGVFSYSYFATDQILDMTTTILGMSALQILAIGMIADMINRRLSR